MLCVRYMERFTPYFKGQLVIGTSEISELVIHRPHFCVTEIGYAQINKKLESSLNLSIGNMHRFRSSCFPPIITHTQVEIID